MRDAARIGGLAPPCLPVLVGWLPQPFRGRGPFGTHEETLTLTLEAEGRTTILEEAQSTWVEVMKEAGMWSEEEGFVLRRNRAQLTVLKRKD